MEKEKHILKSMTDFSQEMFKKWVIDDNPDCQSSARYILGAKKYSDFLKLDLKLGMFIPCDEDENIINEYDWISPENVKWEDYEKQLIDSKKRVLFKGFEIYESIAYPNTSVINRKLNKIIYISDKKIEDIVSKSNNLELTESGAREAGLI